MKQIRKYRHHPDLASATVSIHISDDPTKRHCVIRSLPAGMDICPDVWRYTRQADAHSKFYQLCNDIEVRGFQVESTAHL